MMKNPLAIIFNDVHLQSNNEGEIVESINHLLNYAASKGITNLICAGDFFESRSFQRQSVLITFDKILELIHKAGCTLYLFPGNHDKTEYASYDSFLEIYKFYPGVIFNKEISNIELGGVKITLLPFYADSMLIPMIDAAEGGDVLISHFEMNGSINLGKVSEKSTITRRMLKKWKKTYLGHFHNTHEITKDIVHLPSLRQNNFGEDSNKGFTILYDDLSYEIIKGRFREFNKIVIDVNKVSNQSIKEFIELYRNGDSTIRFEFIGDESKLKSLDKEQFKDTGIDVKIVYSKSYDVTSKEVPKIIEKYDKSLVEDSFKAFCIEKGYDEEYGLKYLREFLEKVKK